MAAAGVRTTKGLYFTFTLLCLVCIAGSQLSKEQLERLKENTEQLQQKVDRLRAKYESEMTTSLEMMNAYMNFFDQMAPLMQKASTELPDDFPPVGGFLENVKVFMVKTKTYIDGQKDVLDAQIKEIEKSLRQQRKLIEFLEENHAEL